MIKVVQGKKLGNVIAKACSGNNFQQLLLTDSTAVLNEEGISVSVGMEIKVVENTCDLVHVILPCENTARALDDAVLHEIVGGFKRPKPKDDDIPLFEI